MSGYHPQDYCVTLVEFDDHRDVFTFHVVGPGARRVKHHATITHAFNGTANLNCTVHVHGDFDDLPWFNTFEMLHYFHDAMQDLAMAAMGQPPYTTNEGQDRG